MRIKRFSLNNGSFFSMRGLSKSRQKLKKKNVFAKRENRDSCINSNKFRIIITLMEQLQEVPTAN